MLRRSADLAFILIVVCGTAHFRSAHAQALPIARSTSQPDPTATPGATDPAVTLDAICKGDGRYERIPKDARDCVLRRYGIPERRLPFYEIARRIPYTIGGSNVCDNLWPQVLGEAEIKDACEIEVHQRICAGRMGLKAAQDFFQTPDWLATCRTIMPGLGAKPSK